MAKTGVQSVAHLTPLSDGAAEFERQERERIKANLARQDCSPRKVLSAQERDRIAEENARYIPLTKRVPAHGVRGCPAAAPLLHGAAARKSGLSS